MSSAVANRGFAEPSPSRDRSPARALSASFGAEGAKSETCCGHGLSNDARNKRRGVPGANSATGPHRGGRCRQSKHGVPRRHGTWTTTDATGAVFSISQSRWDPDRGGECRLHRGTRSRRHLSRLSTERWTSICFYFGALQVGALPEARWAGPRAGRSVKVKMHVCRTLFFEVLIGVSRTPRNPPPMPSPTIRPPPAQQRRCRGWRQHN